MGGGRRGLDRCVYAGVVEHSVYVAPEAQGRGVGRLLLEELIASTEAAGVWAIQSGVFPENTSSGFQSLRESIDTTTPGGRLIFHVFGALAEFERELIRERTPAGLASARARGRVGGRPPAMTPAKLRQAKSMRAAGSSVSEIAEVIGVGRATVYRHLGHEVDEAPPGA